VGLNLIPRLQRSLLFTIAYLGRCPRLLHSAPLALSGASHILVTHDVNTIPKFAYERVRAGQPMPGVIVIPDDLAVGKAIEELRSVVECCEPEEITIKCSTCQFRPSCRVPLPFPSDTQHPIPDTRASCRLPATVCPFALSSLPFALCQRLLHFLLATQSAFVLSSRRNTSKGYGVPTNSILGKRNPQLETHGAGPQEPASTPIEPAYLKYGRDHQRDPSRRTSVLQSVNHNEASPPSNNRCRVIDTWNLEFLLCRYS
jgi:hypothetical protein